MKVNITFVNNIFTAFAENKEQYHLRPVGSWDAAHFLCTPATVRPQCRILDNQYAFTISLFALNIMKG